MFLTAGVHVLLAVLLLTKGLKEIAPLPDQGMLVEFVQEPEPVAIQPVVRTERGEAPRSPQPQPQKEPEYVQQAQTIEPVAGTQRAQESTLGPEGDVAKVEVPAEPEINQRALFRSRDKDTTAAEQTAQATSKTPQAGHALGNVQQGNTAGSPTAQLEGRTVVGKLPPPDYTENTAGQVVVRILVDTYGNVTSATAGVAGTTVQNKKLWEAARKAAEKARFNVSGNAPAVQEGTITYVFLLK